VHTKYYELEMDEEIVFITANRYFVASYLVEHYVSEGCVVRVLVRKEEEDAAKKLKALGAEVIRGCVLDFNPDSSQSAFLDSCLEGVTKVFHLSELSVMEDCKEDLYNFNCDGTKFLVDNCVKEGVKRFVYLSTVGVYGKHDEGVIDETFRVPRVSRKNDKRILRKFNNYYEWSKAQAEYVIFSNINLQSVIVRAPLMYGPRMSRNGPLDYLLDQLNSRLSVVPVDGKINVPLVHVEDVVGAMIFLSDLEDSVSEAYNVVSDDVLSFREMAEIVCDDRGIKRPSWAPVPTREVMRVVKLFKIVPPHLATYFSGSYIFSNDKLKKTGYKLKFPHFKDGVRGTLDYLEGLR